VKRNSILTQIKGGLIVSCQAEADEPLGKPGILAAMARSAVQGGAVAIRACYPENIQAIQTAITVPVIAIYKKNYPHSDVYITPTRKEATALLQTSADIIALDATQRQRPHNEKLTDLLAVLRKNSSCLLMADIATLEDGLQAAELGFDLLSTTLAGYTQVTQSRCIPYQPDFDLLASLLRDLDQRLPVVAEGRFWEPADARRALDLGAHAIVVGSAITRPQLITRRFVTALK